MIVFYIILFLILSAIFSGSEIAFVSANKIGIELKKEKGQRKGKVLAGFYQRPEYFISAMLIGNNLALVVYTSLMERLLVPPLEGIGSVGSYLLITLISTAIVLVFGEFLPKTIFRIFANDLLYFFTYLLKLFQALFYPFSALVNKLSEWIIRVFTRAPVEKTQAALTRIDLEHFIVDTVGTNEDPIETDIFKNALHLKQTRIKEIMVPRTEIQSIDVSADIQELIDLFDSSKHSRIIVYDEDIDNILGYIHHQQLLKNPKSLRRIVLEIPVVPETMNIQALMLKLIKESQTIAWVVDEFGGTAGIITLEDILEEIFGEIDDEHDEEDYIEEQLSENEFLFSGRLEIDYLNDKYEAIDFPEGDYSTLSGYLIMTTGHIPRQDEEIELEGYHFVMAKVDEKKIELVRVIKLKED
ncbi:MAG: HlyC/CorC family transporter [Saprospiraceae bacterium]|nr:HlyC/CorC family transporter [Saprospiraceae bacterium]